MTSTIVFKNDDFSVDLLFLMLAYFDMICKSTDFFLLEAVCVHSECQEQT